MHFKNGRNAENGACTRKGTTSRLMVASMPKDNFLARLPDQSQKLRIALFGFHNCGNSNKNIEK
jgi:hypothetical protein